MVKRRKKSILKSKFYRIYFALVLLGLIGIAVGTVWLRGVLREYESAQPIHKAREVAQLFETADYEALYALDTSARQISEEDRELYVDSLRQLAEGKDVEWTEAFSANADERRYAVTLNDERFATFTLVPSGQTTPHGNRLWTLGEVTTNVVIEEPEPEEPEPTPEPEIEIPAVICQCRVTVPKGYAVSVSGATLSAENAQVTELPMFEAGFLPDGVENPMLVEYIFDSDSEMPAIAVTDESGAPADLTPSETQERAWSCMMKEDAAHREKYGSAALALGKQVAKYISRDANKRSLERICARNSPAETIFDNLSNRYTTPHSKVAFRNEAVSDFYVLSEDCFTCHVSFDFVMETENGERVVPTAYTFCVINQKGEGKLYNLLSY